MRSKLKAFDWTSLQTSNTLPAGEVVASTDLLSLTTTVEQFWTAYDEAVLAMRAGVLQSELLYKTSETFILPYFGQPQSSAEQITGQECPEISFFLEKTSGENNHSPCADIIGRFDPLDTMREEYIAAVNAGTAEAMALFDARHPNFIVSDFFPPVLASCFEPEPALANSLEPISGEYEPAEGNDAIGLLPDWSPELDASPPFVSCFEPTEFLTDLSISIDFEMSRFVMISL